MKKHQIETGAYGKKVNQKSVPLQYNPFQTIGNSAALQLMNKDSTNRTIQRKLGLEFQTVGGNENIEPIPGMSQDNNETELMTVPSRFSVTRDGNDLEYVTEAVDEKSDGPSLLRTVDIITKVHDSILQGNSKTVNKKLQQLGFRIAKNGQPNAHPQASIGVELKSIPQLILDFTSKSGHMFGATTNISNTNEQRRMHSTAYYKTARLGEFPENVSGFLHLLSQYITSHEVRMENKPDTDYAKSFMPFMSRTSLYNLFMLLNNDEKTLAYNIICNNPLYTGKTIIEKGVNETNGPPITTEQLMAAMVPGGIDENAPGTDLIASSDFTGVSLLYTDGYGVTPNKSNQRMQEFGMASPTDIGNDRQGAIIELRALERKVAPGEWVRLTQNILALVNPL